MGQSFCRRRQEVTVPEPDQEPEPTASQAFYGQPQEEQTQQEIWAEVAQLPPHRLRLLASWIDIVGNAVRRLEILQCRRRLQALGRAYWNQLGRQLQALQGSRPDLSRRWGVLGSKLKRLKARLQ